MVLLVFQICLHTFESHHYVTGLTLIILQKVKFRDCVTHQIHVQLILKIYLQYYIHIANIGNSLNSKDLQTPIKCKSMLFTEEN